MFWLNMLYITYILGIVYVLDILYTINIFVLENKNIYVYYGRTLLFQSDNIHTLHTAYIQTCIFGCISILMWIPTKHPYIGVVILLAGSLDHLLEAYTGHALYTKDTETFFLLLIYYSRMYMLYVLFFSIAYPYIIFFSD